MVRRSFVAAFVANGQSDKGVDKGYNQDFTLQKKWGRGGTRPYHHGTTGQIDGEANLVQLYALSLADFNF
jgi:hypothetical protein